MSKSHKQFKQYGEQQNKNKNRLRKTNQKGAKGGNLWVCSNCYREFNKRTVQCPVCGGAVYSEEV